MTSISKTVTIALVMVTGCAIDEQPPEAGAAVAEQSLTVSDSEQAVSPRDAGWTRFPGAHWCATTGYDSNGYQGVDCIDLDYQAVSGGRRYRMTVELKCGTSAGLRQCISGQAYGYFAMNPVDDSGSSWTSRSLPARCVPSGPACNPDMFIFRHPDQFTISTSSCRNFVGVADATVGTGGFTLPDGVQRFVSPLLTPSIRVCGR